jgi:hypothetical protein
MPKKAKQKRAVRGRWQDNQALWYQQTMFYCDACGMLIPKREFIVEANGVERRFCGIECAQLDQRMAAGKRPGATPG